MGNGETIRVFQDPWLGNNENLYIDSNPVPGMRELVESILTPYDVCQMYKIPIGLQKGPDQLIRGTGLVMVYTW